MSDEKVDNSEIDWIKVDKFFSEIHWIYHRLSNGDLIALKEFIDKQLKLARQDERQKIDTIIQREAHNFKEITDEDDKLALINTIRNAIKED